MPQSGSGRRARSVADVPLSQVRQCVRFSLPFPSGLLTFVALTAGHEKSISYATCISVIIGTPFKIETVEQAKRLPKVPLSRLEPTGFRAVLTLLFSPSSFQVGEKLELKIKEFLETGCIEEARWSISFPPLCILVDRSLHRRYRRYGRVQDAFPSPTSSWCRFVPCLAFSRTSS